MEILKRNSKYYYIFIIIIFNFIFYIPQLINTPGFFSDDYYLFSLIKDNPSQFISLNSDLHYSLFLRPLSYLTHFLDFNIWAYNSLIMKLESMMIHITMIILFYFLILKIQRVLNQKENNLLSLIFSIMFSVHIVASHWVLWLSQRNELLMITFYLLSIFSVIKFSEKSQLKYLIAYLIFYVLSVLSKQQSLHLPFLVFVLLYFLKSKIRKQDYSIIFKVNLIAIFIFFFFLFLNIYFRNQGIFFFENMWKKPFTMIGALMFAILPFGSEDIYNYFLVNKNLAITLFVISTITLIAVTFKFKTLRRYLFSIIIVILISFFPQIYLSASNRICSVQVSLIYLGVSSLLVINYRKIPYYFYALLVFFLLDNGFAAFKNEKDIIKVNQFEKNLISQFSKLNEIKPENTLVICNPISFNFPYLFYYCKNNTFGKDSLLTLPLNEEIYNQGEKNALNQEYIAVKINGDTINVKSLFDFVSINYWPSPNDSKMIDVINKKNHYIKSLNEITIKVHTNKERFKNFLYYTNNKWMYIKNK